MTSVNDTEGTRSCPVLKINATREMFDTRERVNISHETERSIWKSLSVLPVTLSHSTCYKRDGNFWQYWLLCVIIDYFMSVIFLLVCLTGHIEPTVDNIKALVWNHVMVYDDREWPISQWNLSTYGFGKFHGFQVGYDYIFN